MADQWTKAALVDALLALKSPIRASLMAELDLEEQTTRQLSRKLGITEATAGFHIRRLVKLGLVEVTREDRSAGPVAKYLRPTALGDYARQWLRSDCSQVAEEDDD